MNSGEVPAQHPNLAHGFRIDIPITRIEPVPIRNPLHVEVSLSLPGRRLKVQPADETLQEPAASFEARRGLRRPVDDDRGDGMSSGSARTTSIASWLEGACLCAK